MIVEDPRKLTKMAADVKRHWWPDQRVTDELAAKIPQGARVLEIGPGTYPFKPATEFIDIKDFGVQLPGPVVYQDCNSAPLPYADQVLDYVYCRHVLEDMHNPFYLCAEMARVAKAGYIETPSPLAEMARGVDAESPNWRGYSHHRWVVWPAQGALCFMGKFPVIEHIEDPAEEHMLKMLEAGSWMWNTSFEWSGNLKTKHIQCPQDFMLPDGYSLMISRSIVEWHADLKLKHQRS